MGKFKRVGVTGAFGFLGKTVCELLEINGFIVVPIARTNGYDLDNLKSLKKLPKIDIMIHLAAQTFVPASLEAPHNFIKNNVLMTLNVLEICRLQNIPVVFASSYVYGPPQNLPVSESHPVAHWNPYASSKLICEELCRSYSKNFSLPIRLLRIFNIFGSNQDCRFLIPKILKGMREGKLALENPFPRRDFLYINDAAAAFVKAINSEWTGCHIYNVGSGKSYSVTDVVNIIAKILDKKTDFVSYSMSTRASEIADVVADISLIKSELNWVPRHSFSEGLELILK